jgi:hypothetical protein
MLISSFHIFELSWLFKGVLRFTDVAMSPAYGGRSRQFAGINAHFVRICCLNTGIRNREELTYIRQAHSSLIWLYCDALAGYPRLDPFSLGRNSQNATIPMFKARGSAWANSRNWTSRLRGRVRHVTRGWTLATLGWWWGYSLGSLPSVPISWGGLIPHYQKRGTQLKRLHTFLEGLLYYTVVLHYIYDLYT